MPLAPGCGDTHVRFFGRPCDSGGEGSRLEPAACCGIPARDARIERDPSIDGCDELAKKILSHLLCGRRIGRHRFAIDLTANRLQWAVGRQSESLS
jgi:hypothetical protein